MSHIILLLSIDEDLGRLDPTLLSDQSRMEIFFDGVKNKAKFTDENGNYTDLESWDGIRFNADGSVDVIDFDLYVETPDVAFKRTLNFAYLPETVTDIGLAHNILVGSLDVADLPSHLKILHVPVNIISGEMETANLPRCLQHLRVEGNFFEGTFDITSLPPVMVTINISLNRLHGSLALTKLPESLIHLLAGENAFFGDYRSHET